MHFAEAHVSLYKGSKSIIHNHVCALKGKHDRSSDHKFIRHKLSLNKFHLLHFTRNIPVICTLVDSAGTVFSLYISASFRQAVVCICCNFILHPAKSTYYVM